MVAMQKLVNSNRDLKLGNHRKETNGDITRYIYHWTAIVTVNETERTYTTDDGGWGTRSTKAAINDYKRKLNDLGYVCIC